LGAQTILAQTFTTLVTFDGADGQDPFTVVQGTNGALYGATEDGGLYGAGTFFQLMTTGRFTTLYSFGADSSGTPFAAPILASNGNFYVTTIDGGVDEVGSVYEMTPAGALTTLYGFCSLPDCADGQSPVTSLVQGVNGDLYGTTSQGDLENLDGTIFSLTLAGKLTTLHTFSATDGANPSALVLGSDGNLYGTTSSGGANNSGTVFKITPAGGFTTLHSFPSGTDDGYQPYAGLVQAANGNC
jgi:uncharacterized repeat protein (TIGR03803 family)